MNRVQEIDNISVDTTQKPSPSPEVNNREESVHARAFTFKKKSELKVPHYFIKDNQDPLSRKAVAVWLKLKSAYHDTKFMNYSVSNCNRVTGISPYLLRKYVPIIINKGWARMIDGDLVLKSFKKMFDPSKDNLFINITGSVQDILEEIYFSHVKRDYSQQKFMSNLGLGRKYAISLRSYKKSYEKYGNRSRRQSATTTSYRRIARQCGVSLSRAHVMCGKWKDERRIRIRTLIEVIEEDVKSSVQPTLLDDGFLIRKNGNMVLIKGSAFYLPQ